MVRSNPTAADSDMITVRVPLTFRRRGGRRGLITPDRAPALAPVGIRANNALVKAIARAHRWRKLMETGVYATVAEIAVSERINPSYASRLLRLTLLAPDLVESLLDGARTYRLDRLLRPFPVEWPVQRTELCCIEKFR